MGRIHPSPLEIPQRVARRFWRGETLGPKLSVMTHAADSLEKGKLPVDRLVTACGSCNLHLFERPALAEATP